MNLSPAIAALKVPGGVTITRREAATYVDGLVVPGATSALVLDPAVVTPAGGKALQVLPEGLRTKGAVQLFTAEPLRTASEPSGVLADLVSWGGETYEVQVVEDWSAMGGYWRSIATEADAT